MKYQEAIDSLTPSKFAVRKAWEDRLSYLVNLPGVINFLKVNILPQVEVIPWAANKEDTMATDWEVIEAVNVQLTKLELPLTELPETEKAA